MKPLAKIAARKLREEEGLSVKEIARRLDISVGSASLWVRDVPLTEIQKEKLSQNNPAINRQINGAKKWSDISRQLRQKAQEDGRKLVKATPTHLLIAGSMLYWAEGSKAKGQVRFVNSDVNMMKFFVRFLREIFLIPNEDLAISIYCYSDNGISFEDIKQHWLVELKLPLSSLRKCRVDCFPSSSYGKKKGKLPFGVCHL